MLTIRDSVTGEVKKVEGTLAGLVKQVNKDKIWDILKEGLSPIPYCSYSKINEVTEVMGKVTECLYSFKDELNVSQKLIQHPEILIACAGSYGMWMFKDTNIIDKCIEEVRMATSNDIAFLQYVLQAIKSEHKDLLEGNIYMKVEEIKKLQGYLKDCLKEKQREREEKRNEAALIRYSLSIQSRKNFNTGGVSLQRLIRVTDSEYETASEKADNLAGTMEMNKLKKK